MRGPFPTQQGASAVPRSRLRCPLRSLPPPPKVAARQCPALVQPSLQRPPTVMISSARAYCLAHARQLPSAASSARPAP
eukprot:12960492-Heterocapsa_arctica.AAC.1